MKNADRVFYFDEGPMATPKIITKALQKTQRDQYHAGGILMSWPSLQWPRRRKARLVSPAQSANLKVLELQTAKEILAEIFRARPEDVEDMIQRRLEERIWREEHEWPATFLPE